VVVEKLLLGLNQKSTQLLQQTLQSKPVKTVAFISKKRTWPGPVMNSMLVYMAENQAEGADAAVEFLQSHEDVWKNWVGAEMRIKIKNAL
jgi:ABC-type proline/glycine betaine transport system substrate-binding protein